MNTKKLLYYKAAAPTLFSPFPSLVKQVIFHRFIIYFSHKILYCGQSKFMQCMNILQEDGSLISFQLLLQCIALSPLGIKIGAPLYGAEIKW